MIKSTRFNQLIRAACGFAVIAISMALAPFATAQGKGAPPSDAGKYDLWDRGGGTGASTGQSQTYTIYAELGSSDELLGVRANGDINFAAVDDLPPPNRKLEDTPRLTVRGEAQLEKPADQIELSIGVETESKDADEAIQENNDRMRAVLTALEQAGLTEDEYETGQFRIRPQYSPPAAQPDPEWRPEIVGYQVTNTINVKTKKLERAGEFIGTANEAGANTVDVRGFSLSDPRKYRSEAIREATGNAIADAQVLAEAASLRLVRIININLDAAPIIPIQRMQAEMLRGTAAAPDAAPPIEAGDITIHASVTIVYEIEQLQD